jgi:hypothetical protein
LAGCRDERIPRHHVGLAFPIFLDGRRILASGRRVKGLREATARGPPLTRCPRTGQSCGEEDGSGQHRLRDGRAWLVCGELKGGTAPAGPPTDGIELGYFSQVGHPFPPGPRQRREVTRDPHPPALAQPGGVPRRRLVDVPATVLVRRGGERERPGRRRGGSGRRACTPGTAPAGPARRPRPARPDRPAAGPLAPDPRCSW